MEVNNEMVEINAAGDLAVTQSHPEMVIINLIIPSLLMT
jgi:hypothetical protein